MKLICAPMATLSHPAFRIMIEKFGGCDEYYTEMINAASLLNGGPFEKYYIDPSPVPEKIVWQITGKSPEPMAEAAALLCGLPGIGIDLNMGCSAPEIVRSGAGVSWMMKPAAETEFLVRSVKAAADDFERKTGVHKRLSVKCRLGDDGFSDEDFFGFIEMLVCGGVEQIAVHPRTRKEKYRDTPRYRYVQDVAEKYPEINVVVNGDVCDRQSFDKVRAVCPSCAGVMIGRAAVSSPWIFSMLNGAGGAEQVDLEELALGFIGDVEKYLPREFWKTRLQRFFAYYSSNFSFAHYIQSKLLNASGAEEARAVLAGYFAQVPEDRIINFY